MVQKQKQNKPTNKQTNDIWIRIAPPVSQVEWTTCSCSRRKGLECNHWVWLLSDAKCSTESFSYVVLKHYLGIFTFIWRSRCLGDIWSPSCSLAGLGFKPRVTRMYRCIWFSPPLHANYRTNVLRGLDIWPFCKFPWTHPLLKDVSSPRRHPALRLPGLWPSFLSLSLSCSEGGRDGISTSKPQKFWMNISIPISATLTPVRKPKRS